MSVAGPNWLCATARACFFCATSTSGLPSREVMTFQCTLPHQPLPSVSATALSKANTVTMPPFSKKVVRW